MGLELNDIKSLRSHTQAPNQPSWLAEKRSIAFDRYTAIGLPDVHDEDWRYTNLAKLKQLAFSQLGVETSVSHMSSDIELSGLELEPVSHTRLVFVNGRYSEQLSTTIKLTDGLSASTMSKNLETNADFLKPYFGSTLPKAPKENAKSPSEKNNQRHGFIELNTAFCQEGYVVIAQATSSDEMIEVVYAHTADADGQVNNYRNFIIAQANSKVTVVERHIGVNGSVYLNNSITEIVADDNAQVDHYKLQTESADAFHMAGTFCHQQRSSTVKNHNVSLGGLIVRNDVNMQLLGEGAHAEMNGLVFSEGLQHTDNFTEVNHAVPHCTSDEHYKNILDNKSRSVFRGRIIVAEDAQQTDAQQQNNNLLLSADAEIDSKPQLEIYADDVKCSHGATVGQLDPKSIFYLQSRGIDQATARALLTFAFANEVIQRINIESIRDELTSVIAGQLIQDIEGVL